jgi:GntR family transcriptional regulator
MSTAPIRRVARNRAAQRDQRGFYADVQDAGLTPDVQTTIEDRPAPADVTERLGVQPGTPVLTRARHMAAGGTPLQLATTYFAPQATEQIPQLREHNTGPGGMLARFEDRGWTLTQTDYVSAPPADERTRTALNITNDTGVLRIVRVTENQDGQTLEVTVLDVAGDRNELVYAI